MELGDALAWLDRHDPPVSRPGVADRAGSERVRALLDVLGNPERSMPVVVVSGRRGKTAVVRAIGALIGSKGLSVGTVTSPHLSRVNERLAVGGEVVGDSALAELLSDLAVLEPLLAGVVPARAELLLAGGLSWFSDRPVHAAVLEAGSETTDPVAGIGAVVEVTTGLGAVVSGDAETWDDERAPDTHRWVPGADFGCSRHRSAVGGRSVDVWTPGATYEGVWLGVHGRHQADNFAVALAASEAFFGAPIEEGLVREAAAGWRLPGQLEVVGHRPTVLVDTASDPLGASSVAATLDEDFAVCASRIVVLGLRDDADPAEMLSALGAGRARLVVACDPGEPGTRSAGEVARAAADSGVEVVERDSVAAAVHAGVGAARPDDLVLIVGPPAMIGSARVALGARAG